MENLDDVKAMAIDRARQLANIALSETDYKIVRQIEQSTLSDLDFAALKAERQAVRDACNALEANISNCATIAEVRVLVPARE